MHGAVGLSIAYTKFINRHSYIDYRASSQTMHDAFCWNTYVVCRIYSDTQRSCVSKVDFAPETVLIILRQDITFALPPTFSLS